MGRGGKEATMIGKVPQMPDPKPFVPRKPSGPPPLTASQKADIAIKKSVDAQRVAEIGPTLPGVIGVAMLCATAYLIWRRQ